MLFVRNDNCSMSKTSTTLDNWVNQERFDVGIGHSATRPLSHSATQPLGHSATYPPIMHSLTQLAAISFKAASTRTVVAHELIATDAVVLTRVT